MCVPCERALPHSASLNALYAALHTLQDMFVLSVFLSVYTALDEPCQGGKAEADTPVHVLCCILGGTPAPQHAAPTML